jgi:hypothetical protein
MRSSQISTAIAEHRHAYKAWQAWLTLDIDCRAECHEASDLLFEAFLNASDRLFRTKPATVADALALLNYIIGKHDDPLWFAQGGVELTKPILRSIREVLRTARG